MFELIGKAFALIMLAVGSVGLAGVFYLTLKWRSK